MDLDELIKTHQAGIPLLLLRAFIGQDERRPALCRINFDGANAWATNSKLIVRTSCAAPVDDPESTVKKLLPIFSSTWEATKSKTGQWIDLPAGTKKACPICKGTGKEVQCPSCRGRGEFFFDHDWIDLEKQRHTDKYTVECKQCDGTGYFGGNPNYCDRCLGQKEIYADLSIDNDKATIRGDDLRLLYRLPRTQVWIDPHAKSTRAIRGEGFQGVIALRLNSQTD